MLAGIRLRLAAGALFCALVSVRPALAFTADTDVPEPPPMILLGCGLVIFLIGARFKKHPLRWDGLLHRSPGKGQPAIQAPDPSTVSPRSSSEALP
jgi:hypothetical protein